MSLEPVTVPNEILFAHAKQLIDQGHDVTLTVVGHSMQPFFEGYREDVKLEKCEKAKANDFVLTLTDEGRYVAHRVVYADEERIIMRGDGNVYGKEHAKQENIVGIITAYRRTGGNGEFKKMYSWKWKLFTTLWPRNPWVRRLFLAFHHHVYLKMLWLLAKPEWMKIEKTKGI